MPNQFQCPWFDDPIDTCEQYKSQHLSLIQISLFSCHFLLGPNILRHFTDCQTAAVMPIPMM
jgi:hypothetical protein